MGADHLVIDLENIRFTYPDGRSVLKELSFKLAEGARAGLIGPNGSGKTTLLHMLMGLIPQTEGTIRLFGREMQSETDFRESRKKIGLVFQNADDQLFSPTVLEDVAFGPLNLGAGPSEAKEIAIKTLNDLNLTGFEDRISYRLSGGEKKLVALATVLAMDPAVLVMDEPTTGLDEETNDRIVNILNTLDKTLLIVSHEYDFLARTTRNFFSMRQGQVFDAGDSSKLHTHIHAHIEGGLPHKHRNLIK
ncbi:MAG: ABC transporter ATP-binding protein [Desulfobacterales bacterium]|nr:ABC transporter ATP-binding protein [Desulfobacterales bacterium]